MKKKRNMLICNYFPLFRFTYQYGQSYYYSVIVSCIFILDVKTHQLILLFDSIYTRILRNQFVESFFTNSFTNSSTFYIDSIRTCFELIEGKCYSELPTFKSAGQLDKRHSIQPTCLQNSGEL